MQTFADLTQIPCRPRLELPQASCRPFTRRCCSNPTFHVAKGTGTRRDACISYVRLMSRNLTGQVNLMCCLRLFGGMLSGESGLICRFHLWRKMVCHASLGNSLVLDHDHMDGLAFFVCLCACVCSSYASYSFNQSGTSFKLQHPTELQFLVWRQLGGPERKYFWENPVYKYLSGPSPQPAGELKNINHAF